MEQRKGYFSSWIKLFLLFITFVMSADGQWYKPWCLVTECCNEDWIPRDYDGVKKSLDRNVFGQPSAKDVIYASLKGHANSQPVKPLVLSFHGSTGTGKTFASQWIAQNWFKRGMDSKFVHFYTATKHFPLKSKVNFYTAILQNEIYSHTKSCGHQLFIFDEVDSLPPGLLESLRSFMEYYGKVDGVRFTNTIFVFLSNIGELSLQKISEDIYKSDCKRESLKLPDIEPNLVSDIYNTGTGLGLSRLIDNHLISHFVPFLPLEKPHVEKCILRELRRLQLHHDLKLVDYVVNELQFGGLDNNFSVKGCKNVVEKIYYVISMRTFKPREEL